MRSTPFAVRAASQAPGGDPKDAPPAVKFVEGWNIPTPDRVIEMPREYAVPAGGTIDYTYIVVPTRFTEDRWVQAAEVRPGNRALVHHVIVYVREPGNPWLKDAPAGEAYVPPASNRAVGGEYLAGFTPGKPAMQLAEGQGKLIKAGIGPYLPDALHDEWESRAGSDQCGSHLREGAAERAGIDGRRFEPRICHSAIRRELSGGIQTGFHR